MSIKDKIDYSLKEDMTSGIAITFEGAVFATIDGTDEEAVNTARELVKRWNCHRDLVSACEISLSYVNAVITKVPRPIEDLEPDKKAIEAALAQD